ncbi:flagellar filament capping protein FliD [Pseudomonas oligotrophica]|uniref:flagellar filament capping protein FliD n=1 Tax=Pseudomonas oligotrophica TaxID=2912055 RepID=UPI001F02755E|nr:flagellar filament capping protein FliD [Pseudomonas oligotrophica]MCF7200609.1 flagellar filament capping protein FliD [Pseudomonas oligotrophica]
MAIDSAYVQQMATQLATYEVQTSLDRLNRNETSYKAQRTALSSLRSALTTFKSTLTKLGASTSSMLVNSASFSAEGYASASVGTTAQPGSYQFYVEQLASKQQVAVQGLADGSLNGTLTLKGQAFDLSAYATLDDAAKAINATADLGVQATLVRSNGAVSLVLSSAESGAANGFAYDLAGSSGSTLELSQAQDARIRMGGSFGSGGIEMTSASNSFDNLVDGLSLTVSKVHNAGDAPLGLTIAQDKSATKTQVQTFIDAFNTLMGSIDGLTASGSQSASRGPLAGDSSVRSIESRLNGLLRTGFGGVSLIDFGISADRNGKLTLDAARFEKAVAANPDAFEALFTGKDQLIDSLDKAVATYTSSADGVLKNRMDTLDLNLRRIDEQFETLQSRYDNYYMRYLRQYTNMMQTMQGMEQTSGMFG